MATRFWIKLFIGMLDDPSVARLPDGLWRRFVELSLLAGKEGNDGALPPVEEMAWILRLSEGKVLEDLQGLEEAGVVCATEDGKWVVTDFAKQQTAVPVEERVRQYRERRGGFVPGGAASSHYVTNRYKRGNEGGGEESNSPSPSDSESDSLNGEEEKTPSGSATSPISKDRNGGGRAEARLPRTPGEAMDDPDMQVFEAVTGGRIPGISQYGAVIEAVRLLRRREKLEEAELREYLRPYWLAWSGRKRQDGRPYDPGNITWLVEWALNGSVPLPSQGTLPLQGTFPGGPKGAEAMRPAIATPEETRRMLDKKDEILKQAVPMPEEVRAKLRGLAKKMGGKEEPT